MQHLSESTFLLYAMNCYDNPSCHDISEFEQDIKRFQYLQRLFNRYKQFDDLRERLILNHLIVLYNVFGYRATNMLFFRLEEYHECLKPFLDYLSYTPEYIEYNGKRIETKRIQSDINIENILRRI
jgi:adenylate kinase family enzyme